MSGRIQRITYNGYSSNEFPTFTLLTDCSFDSANGEVSSFLNRDAVSSESYNGSMHYVTNYKYTEVLTPTITFIKDDYSNFEQDEIQKVLAWLTSRNTPSFADFYDDIDSNVIVYSLLGAWTDIQIYKVANGRVVGITAEFESTSPWGWSALKTISKTISTPTTFVINSESDNYSTLLYPKVVITQGNSVVVPSDHAMTDRTQYLPNTVYSYASGGSTNYYWIDASNVLQTSATNTSGVTATSVLIENTTLNTQTKISGNVVSEVVALDGANRVVSSSRISRIFGEDFNWSWFPIRQGNNTIKITGNCDIAITWREPIKLGEY